MSDDGKLLRLCIVGVLVVSVLGWLTYIYEKGVSEELSICDTQSTPVSNTVFLVDFSDPQPESVVNSLKEDLRRHQNLSVVGGQLTLLRVTRESYVEESKICKPPHPRIRNKRWECRKNLSGIDKPRQAESDRFCQFNKSVDSMLETINERSQDSLPTSPLLESLVEISQREDFAGVSARKIVLYSDLLQNTCQYSFYPSRYQKCGTKPDAETVLSNISLDLSGAEIEIQYLPNPSFSTLQTSALHFWQDLFESVGINAVFTPLPIATTD